MLRRYASRLLAAVFVAATVLPATPVHAQGSPPPDAVSLTRGWSFHPDPADHGLGQHWQTTPPAAGWKPVAVPHVFDPRPEKRAFHGTVGWYRLVFTGPATPVGFDWGVHFEQARRNAHVWLNGRDLGRHADPYVPFTLEAHGLLPGKPNTLVVRVDNRKGAEPREGWWNWGGLTRPVSLVPLGGLVTHQPGFMSQVDCQPGGASCAASLLVDATVENHSTAPIDAPRLRLTLTPPGGGDPITATEDVRPLAPGESARVRFPVSVPDAKLWSPDAPNLYNAMLQTVAGDEVMQVDRRAVGLREVEVRDGILELNGKQVDLRGAAIQEDVRGRGPALTDADMDAIVAQLKAVHANVTRAHYLLNEGLLDRLDRAGIMVWSQAPIYHRDKLLETEGERAAALATVRNTVLAARSHPSVITHSVANELKANADEVPGTRTFLADARALVKDLDPTIPVSVDLLSYPGYARQEAYAAFDLLGINSYFGWYPGKKAHPTGRLSDLAPYLDKMRRMYPRQGLVLTEFGAESTYNGPAQDKQTYAFQSRYVRDVLRIVEERPFLSGAIYWTLREFAVKPDWDGGAHWSGPRDAIHHKGLISYSGWRKPAWGVAEKDFASTPLYRDISASVAPGTAAHASVHGGGGSLAAIFAALGILALLAVDAWALAGILGVRLPRVRGSRVPRSAPPRREHAPAHEPATESRLG